MGEVIQTIYRAPEIPTKFDIIPIHNSDRAAFKRCRRYWNWSSPARNNLMIRADLFGVNVPMWFGTGIHYALEQYYTPGLSKDPTAAFKEWFDIQWRGGIVTEEWLDRVYDLKPEPMTKIEPTWPNGPMNPVESVIDGLLYKVRGLEDIIPDPDHEVFDEHFNLGIQMMDFYKQYAEKNDDFVVLMNEHIFSVPIWDFANDCILTSIDLRENSPNYGKTLEVHARGRQDSIYARNNKLGIIDHKTAASIGDRYFDKLENDEQCTCVTMDAEALTPSGWKTRNQLEPEDIIMAYDQETDKLVWSEIIDITDAEAEVFNFGNNKGTFRTLVTANHRWIGHRVTDKWYINKVPTEWRTDEFPTSSRQLLKIAAEFDSEGILDISTDEAALLGWILTDGSLTYSNRTIQCSIGQSVSKYTNEIYELIERLSVPHSVAIQKPNKISLNYDFVTWRISAPYIRELLLRANFRSREDDLTEFVIGLSSDARKAFCDAGYKAEGTSPSDTNQTFFQNDGNVKEAFRLAYTLCGIGTTIGNHKGFGLKQNPHYDGRTLKSSSAGIQQVWCPTTEHGTWLMRQEKQITITGNTYLWAAEVEAKYYDLPHKNQPFEEVIYNVLRKAYPTAPTVLKSGMFSVDRENESTTYEILSEWIRKNLPSVKLSEKQQNYVDWLKEIGDENFIIREPVRRNRHQLVNAGQRLYLEALDMLNEPRIYPNIDNDWLCLSCQFRAPCLAKEDGGDYEQLIRDNYTVNKDR